MKVNSTLDKRPKPKPFKAMELDKENIRTSPEIIIVISNISNSFPSFPFSEFLLL
jgi:hypothetical protein